MALTFRLGDGMSAVKVQQENYEGVFVVLGTYRDSPLDHVNAEVALGGVAFGVTTLGIVLHNREWQQAQLRRTNAVSEEGFPVSGPFLALSSVCEVFVTARTYIAFYFPAFHVAFGGGSSWLCPGPQNISNTVLDIWASLGLLIVPSPLGTLPTLAILWTWDLRSVRYSEAYPFTFWDCFVPALFYGGSSRLLSLLSVAVALYMGNECVKSVGKDIYCDCDIPFWFWKDPLEDKLYVF